MEIKYLGHSAFLVKGGNIKALIDPFINGNASNNLKSTDFKDITHIFVTHGHGDHIGDTIEIAKRCNSKIICNFEMGYYFDKFELNIHTMHIGGRVKFDFGKVKMTPALHGSGIFYNGEMIDGGNPCGFVIEVQNKKIYHAGDTGLTMDMKLLKDEKIDIALLPIGGNYTMDIDDAVLACGFIEPKKVIPMHYNTFDIIKADPDEFKRKVEKSEVIVAKVNENITV